MFSNSPIRKRQQPHLALNEKVPQVRLELHQVLVEGKEALHYRRQLLSVQVRKCLVEQVPDKLTDKLLVVHPSLHVQLAAEGVLVHEAEHVGENHTVQVETRQVDAVRHHAEHVVEEVHEKCLGARHGGPDESGKEGKREVEGRGGI